MPPPRILRQRRARNNIFIGNQNRADRRPKAFGQANRDRIELRGDLRQPDTLRHRRVEHPGGVEMKT